LYIAGLPTYKEIAAASMSKPVVSAVIDKWAGVIKSAGVKAE
jgi:hypothetical protein